MSSPYETEGTKEKEYNNNNGNGGNSKNPITAEDIMFVIATISKEAPYDVVSIKQIFYGMLSAFTRLPLHHSVESRKSGSGKTHDVMITVGYFPKKYFLLVAGMSDKALYHRSGTLVIVEPETGNTIPAQPLIDDIASKIEQLEIAKKASKNKKEINAQIKENKAKIQDIYDKCQKLIELDNTIFLFLDTAQEGLFNTLMSMISQDTIDDQLYEFTDKSVGGKLGSKINRLRGTPTIFNTQVIDDTRQVRYAEKNRRLIHVIPDTSTQKIQTAADQIAIRYSVLPEEYDEQVVSAADKERAKDIVSRLVENLIDHTKPFERKKSGVKIPFFRSMVKGIHRNKTTAEEWVMTVTDRTVRYLSIITKANMGSRPKIIDTQTGKVYPVATFTDLKETLQLMVMASSMARPYIANWYNEYFIPAFKALPDQPRSITKEITNYQGTKEEITIFKENEIGLTSKELAIKTTEGMRRPISVEQIREQFLYPLKNMGIINSSPSIINRREHLYSPVEDSIFSVFDSDNDLRLKITDVSMYPERYPSKNVLEEEFRIIVKQAAKWGVENEKNDNDNENENKEADNFKRYILQDIDGSELTVSELIDRYLSDPETCFIKG